MSDTLKVAQISDCHLPGRQGTFYRGIDPWTNLERLLEQLHTDKPHLLMVTGDLSEDATPASYRDLRNLLGKLGVPLLALPGNHDEPRTLEQFFPSSPVDYLSVTNHARWQIVRLNSCVQGQVHGEVDPETLGALETLLETDPGRPRLLALHHQPLTIDSPWIDKYRLFKPDALLKIIDDYADIKVVVWGHIHQVFESKRNDTLMLGGPSSAINSLGGMEEFTPDSMGPAYRWLELGSSGEIHHQIITA